MFLSFLLYFLANYCNLVLSNPIRFSVVQLCSIFSFIRKLAPYGVNIFDRSEFFYSTLSQVDDYGAGAT